ncbi:MAG: hypothetical protein FWG10_02920 [Eubacteriaceae bacterium]|nr:hypothetical protein [Eubacteriaceae bacterium]
MRKSYSSEFKTKVVLDIIKGDRTLSEVASNHNQAIRWKSEFLKNCHMAFEGAEKAAEKERKMQDELDEAYCQLGKVTAMCEWLKKKSGREP